MSLLHFPMQQVILSHSQGLGLGEVHVHDGLSLLFMFFLSPSPFLCLLLVFLLPLLAHWMNLHVVWQHGPAGQCLTAQSLHTKGMYKTVVDQHCGSLLHRINLIEKYQHNTMPGTRKQGQNVLSSLS